MKLIKKAISINPSKFEALNNLGISLKDQGKLKEAIEVYKKVLSANPDNVDAYNNLGVALKDQGKLKEAIVAYEKVLSMALIMQTLITTWV